MLFQLSLERTFSPFTGYHLIPENSSACLYCTMLVYIFGISHFDLYYLYSSTIMHLSCTMTILPMHMDSALISQDSLYPNPVHNWYKVITDNYIFSIELSRRYLIAFLPLVTFLTLLKRVQTCLKFFNFGFFL